MSDFFMFLASLLRSISPVTDAERAAFSREHDQPAKADKHEGTPDTFGVTAIAFHPDNYQGE